MLDLAYGKISSRHYLVEIIKMYTMNNFSDSSLSINFVSAVLERNANLPSPLFVQTVGYTYSEFINRIRIEQACQFLSTITIASYGIANKVGFSNYRYFSRVLKDTTEMTPHQGRNHL